MIMVITLDYYECYFWKILFYFAALWWISYLTAWCWRRCYYILAKPNLWRPTEHLNLAASLNICIFSFFLKKILLLYDVFVNFLKTKTFSDRSILLFSSCPLVYIRSKHHSFQKINHMCHNSKSVFPNSD